MFELVLHQFDVIYLSIITSYVRQFRPWSFKDRQIDMVDLGQGRLFQHGLARLFRWADFILHFNNNNRLEQKSPLENPTEAKQNFIG